MSEPVRIVVVIEGGAVLTVCTLGVPAQYVIIDYDVDDAEDVVELPQASGRIAEAVVSEAYDAETIDPAILAAIEGRFE